LRVHNFNFKNGTSFGASHPGICFLPNKKASDGGKHRLKSFDTFKISNLPFFQFNFPEIGFDFKKPVYYHLKKGKGPSATATRLLKNFMTQKKNRLNNFKDHYIGQFELIKKVWCGQYPTATKYLLSKFEKSVMIIMLSVRLLCLGQFMHSWLPKEERRHRVGYYISAWVIVLIVLLFFPFEPWGYAWIISYHLAELIVAQLCIIFVDSYGEYLGLRSLNGVLQLLLINYFAFILGFAALYRWTGSIGNKEVVLTSPGDSIYFSIVTITTLGFGEFTPQNGVGKTLVSLEALIGVIFVALVLATFLTFRDSLGK